MTVSCLSACHIFGTLTPPHTPASLPSLSFLCLFSFHVFSFCSSQSYWAFLSCLGSRPASLRLHFALCTTGGARSSAAAPVAFTCLTAPSHLLSRSLFISLSVCLSISMIVYLLSSSAPSFCLCHSLLHIFHGTCISYLLALCWPY